MSQFGDTSNFGLNDKPLNDAIARSDGTLELFTKKSTEVVQPLQMSCALLLKPGKFGHLSAEGVAELSDDFDIETQAFEDLKGKIDIDPDFDWIRRNGKKDVFMKMFKVFSVLAHQSKTYASNEMQNELGLVSNLVRKIDELRAQVTTYLETAIRNKVQGFYKDIKSFSRAKLAAEDCTRPSILNTTHARRTLVEADTSVSYVHQLRFSPPTVPGEEGSLMTAIKVKNWMEADASLRHIRFYREWLKSKSPNGARLPGVVPPECLYLNDNYSEAILYYKLNCINTMKWTLDNGLEMSQLPGGDINEFETAVQAMYRKILSFKASFIQIKMCLQKLTEELLLADPAGGLCFYDFGSSCLVGTEKTSFMGFADVDGETIQRSSLRKFYETYMERLKSTLRLSAKIQSVVDAVKVKIAALEAAQAAANATDKDKNKTAPKPQTTGTQSDEPSPIKDAFNNCKDIFPLVGHLNEDQCDDLIKKYIAKVRLWGMQSRGDPESTAVERTLLLKRVYTAEAKLAVSEMNLAAATALMTGAQVIVTVDPNQRM
eukprot:TRINITY_DN3083_c0_g1_i2.p1 TRINITY_DN3083_c0_g1~~TRINITY_DN3083_c0_g1_i2.p1  ORF type:complete len:545 (+),score=129.00 TRINITY_DN3083_c0_g1_i2:23-1657(+)